MQIVIVVQHSCSFFNILAVFLGLISQFACTGTEDLTVTVKVSR